MYTAVLHPEALSALQLFSVHASIHDSGAGGGCLSADANSEGSGDGDGVCLGINVNGGGGSIVSLGAGIHTSCWCCVL